MIHDANHVISGDAVVLWDGITRPEEKEDKSIVHNIRVAMLPTAVEKGELDNLAARALVDSEFKGVLPAGGNMPFSPVDVAKFGPIVTGMVAFTAQTRKGAPTVVDANGREMSAIQYARSFYPGAIVRVLVHAFPYNNKQKGIGFGLDGIQIINDKAPALDIGTGGLAKSEVMGAFGGAPAASGGTKQMAPGCPYTYDALVAAGWTDQAMIQAGHLLPPAPVAAPTPAAPAPMAAPAPAPVAPAHDLVPASKQSKMTAAAQFPYDAYIASGWTDANLIANGLMTA